MPTTYSHIQIQSLRTAFTLNNALKRLFLSSTSLTSPGAIALAEFLPESQSLLHLDLTNNNIDLAGVMALSQGLKANHVMRCLDLMVPPGDEQFARFVLFFLQFYLMWICVLIALLLCRMCRDILNTCVRNTEEAERSTQSAKNGVPDTASGRGLGKGVWGMIEESELAKTMKIGTDKV
jgi:protein phosphatase 1 regulatory subunit 37